jgi:type II secretory pathway predicted ATPase ExeA
LPIQGDSAHVFRELFPDRPIMPTTPSGSELELLLQRRERVFPAYPQVGRYFPAASIEDARRRICRAIDRGDGPCLVVGGPGTGKSLLLQVLAAQYHEQFDVVLLACAPLRTRRALLQAILFELGLPHRMTGEGDLRLSLLDHLLSSPPLAPPRSGEGSEEGGLLLLVDEAQSLSPALLDELRVMTNLVRGGAPRVRLVLAGSAALEESFANVELESFSQRLSSRCYLAPMTRNETSQFIRAQIAASGGDPHTLFVEESAGAVFEATDGVPRLVNQLCDRALVMAEAQDLAHIDRILIQAAWSDLQQLPTPWEMPASASSAAPPAQVVEFGALRDEPFALDAAREEMAEIEPTELDVDDEPQELPMPSGVTDCSERAVRDPADPFGEQFDEEEFVLDNFAAWDNVFLRDRIRVENRRDPGFASLVQDAINAASVEPMPAENAVPEGLPAARLMPAPIDDEADQFTIPGESIEENADVSPEIELPFDEAEPVPPLRLAVVPELMPLAPIPLIPALPVDAAGSAAFDPVVPEDDGMAFGNWFTNFAAGALEQGAELPDCVQLLDDEPILVIEEDSPERPARKPQAQRQEYRQLFSRLRSG